MRNTNLKDIKFKVKWRGGFADRNKHFPISTDIQIESLDERVRTRIYNFFIDVIKIRKMYPKEKESFINSFLQEFYLTDYVYDLNYRGSREGLIFLEAIKDTIYKDDWANVFTFIEFWIETEKNINYDSYDDFKGAINNILEKEFVGYRLVGAYIVPITDEIEVQAIEQSSSIPHSEVKRHISKALEKLSDRENPDYENSIKESICSVEAMVKIVIGDNKTTLGKGLKVLKDKGVNIHPSLEQAFSKLYGYAGDESGIRHSGKIGGKDSTFEEAKFMLVACTAFNNYLLSNSK